MALSGIATASAATTTSSPGSTTTTVPTPPTTVAELPPPPPFAPGDDFGRLLLQHRRDAQAALAGATNDIAGATQLVALTTDHVKVAKSGLAQARAHARAVKLQLVAVHQEVKDLAVDAYI